ncbi:hypothetical protein HYU11_02330 [Candidatus Woesearchaeota archaeon]|nr:hypothetical protein [Candidatus Woesearchaeota archaeon]
MAYSEIIEDLKQMAADRKYKVRLVYVTPFSAKANPERESDAVISLEYLVTGRNPDTLLRIRQSIVVMSKKNDSDLMSLFQPKTIQDIGKIMGEFYFGQQLELIIEHDLFEYSLTVSINPEGMVDNVEYTSETPVPVIKFPGRSSRIPVAKIHGGQDYKSAFETLLDVLKTR